MFTACSSDVTGDLATTTAPEVTAADRGPVAAGSCIDTYSLDTLTERDFAFDGTVVDLQPADPDGDDASSFTDRVRFEVHAWFAGGEGDTVELQASGFGSTSMTSAAEGFGDVGDRLLVTGDDDFVWGCGFTQVYDADTAADWAEVFES